jgi:predicted RecA/RadA family phage recombinase
MAKNFQQPGDVMSFTAPYDLASGAGFLVGLIFAVAQTQVLSGATVQGATVGIWTLVKTTGAAWTFGQALYWDNTNKKVITTATGNKFIGYAAFAAASADATGSVKLALSGAALS